MEIVGHASGRELLEGLSVVEELVSLGIGVELQLTGQVLDSFTYKDYGKIKELVGELPITVHAPFMDLNPGALEPYTLTATRNRFKEVASAAKVLGAKVLIFHTGYHPQKVEPVYDAWFQRALETFQEVAQVYPGRIALENVFDGSPQNLLNFLSRLPSNFGVCLDTGHINLFSTVPLSEWFSSFGEKIFEFHVHDNDGVSDLHAPIGTGTFNFEELFKLLENLNSDYIFNLENKSPRAVEESLKALRRYQWKGKSESTPTKS
jgi:sugar phosphate isomerase/epimerase